MNAQAEAAQFRGEAVDLRRQIQSVRRDILDAIAELRSFTEQMRER